MSEVLVRYYPVPSLFHAMAVLYGMRVARVLCVCVTTSRYRPIGVSSGDATQCARQRMTAPCSAYTKRFLILMIPLRRDCAKFVSESIADMNM
jgi:hypothetical protein